QYGKNLSLRCRTTLQLTRAPSIRNLLTRTRPDSGGNKKTGPEGPVFLFCFPDIRITAQPVPHSVLRTDAWPWKPVPGSAGSNHRCPPVYPVQQSALQQFSFRWRSMSLPAEQNVWPALHLWSARPAPEPSTCTDRSGCHGCRCRLRRGTETCHCPGTWQWPRPVYPPAPAHAHCLWSGPDAPEKQPEPGTHRVNPSAGSSLPQTAERVSEQIRLHRSRTDRHRS